MMIKAALTIFLTAGLLTFHVGCCSPLSCCQKSKLCDDRAKPVSCEARVSPVPPVPEVESTEPTDEMVPVPTPPQP